MKKDILGYKIIDPITGLYAISISQNKWGKTGRTWSRMCDVIRVINNGIKRSKASGTSDALYNRIITLEIIELAEEKRYSTIHCIDKIKF